MTNMPIQPWQEVSPDFAHYSRDILFGEIWERPGLSKRDRSLMVVSALTVLYRTSQLRVHIGRALDNGVTREELGEVFLQLAFYGGWPVAVNAMQQAKDVYDERDERDERDKKG